MIDWYLMFYAPEKYLLLVLGQVQLKGMILFPVNIFIFLLS